MRALVPTLIFALTLFACGESSSSPPSRPSEPATDRGGDPVMRPIAGGVSWAAEEPFVYRRPDNEYRAHEYTVRDQPDVTLAISHFAAAEGGGGDVQANIDRWVGQFEQPDGSESRAAAQVDAREINDLRVTTVDLTGTFVGRMGTAMGGQARPGWRMLGAIVEGPQGLVFLKLIGPAAGVAAAEDAFERLVASLHPE